MYTETQDEDPGEPLSLDEIFSPYFAVRHFDATWIDAKKRRLRISISSASLSVKFLKPLLFHDCVMLCPSGLDFLQLIS